MTEVEKEVDFAEAFRVAADNARNTLIASISNDAAPSPEPGSSPAIGAESDVPVKPDVGEADAKVEIVAPEVKPDGVTIDPEAAWNQYASDDERKKALAHNKAYAAEMSRKARELEAKLAEVSTPKVADTPKTEVVPETPVVEENPDDVPYEDWVKATIEKPQTEEQRKIAARAAEYNQFVAEKVTPIRASLDKAGERVRAANVELEDREKALKFLQSRKDVALFEDEIREAKQSLADANAEFLKASNEQLRMNLDYRDIESERLTGLGMLRNHARTAREAEIALRRDSASSKKAENDAKSKQAEIDRAWEQAKLDSVTSRGVTDEAMQQVLKDAADGALIRAANSGKNISVDGYSKFIEEALKPFAITVDKTREDAVKKIIAITDEPGPAKATSDKPNVDAQPITYDEWRRQARMKLSGKA